MSHVHFTLDSNKVKKKYSIINVSESTDIRSSKISSQHCTSKLHSIICNDTTTNIQNVVRKDAYGNYITKGKKNFRVTFVDNISNKRLTEIILIERAEERKIELNNQANCDCGIGCILL